MFIKLLFLFVGVPVVEIYFLLQVHGMLGLAPTVALVLLTGIAGAYLMRVQGIAVLQRLVAELNDGRIPGNEILDGALVLAGGLLLLTPGFCTDLTGFFLLTPWLRRIIRPLLLSWLRHQVAAGKIRIHCR